MSAVPTVSIISTDAMLAEKIRPQVTKGQSSISGLSSGAFMTVQMHLAHSSRFCGAGIIAGGPYRCAAMYRRAAALRGDANILTAYFIGMNPLIPSVAPSGIELAKQARERSGTDIDPIGHLKDQRLYIFSGTQDKVVYQSSVEQTKLFYHELGVNDRHVKWVSDVAAGHAIITRNPEDSPLSTNQPPYINRGDFIQSHDILKTIYPDSHSPTHAAPLTGLLHRFSQLALMPGDTDNERYDNLKNASMSEFGYVYVPASVLDHNATASEGHHHQHNQPVRIHMVMHGCKQGYNYTPVINGRPDTDNYPPYGNRYITTTGYNEYADLNNMIVIYPQAEGVDDGKIQNPDGCWDWWGYTGDDFYSKNALQIRALSRILEHFGG